MRRAGGLNGVPKARADRSRKTCQQPSRNPGRPALIPCVRNDGVVWAAGTEARAGLCPPTTRGGQPRPRPARVASTMSMAARIALDISILVVSSKWASAACFSGETARFVSRSSRLRMSASTVASSIERPCALVFQRAAAGAHLRRRGDENLNVGAGTNDGADVAAVEHGAGRLRGKAALHGDQHGAHVGKGRDDGGGVADRGRLQRRLVELCQVEALRGGDRGIAVVGLARRHRARPWPPRDRAARCRDGAARNARRGSCRACPCPRPPVRRWR